MFDKNQIEKFKSLISSQKNWVIIPHVSPDGDAIGASLAFLLVLSELDVNARVIVPDTAPQFLSFLPGMDQLIVGKQNQNKADTLILKADVVLLLDHNDFKRSANLSDAVVKNNGQKIVVDHHPHPAISKTDALTFYNVQASSTCEIVYDLLSQMNLETYISGDVASVLMTGLITDTGGFNYNCSRGHFFNTVAALLEKGAQKDLIIDQVYNQYSEHRMRLIGYLMNHKMEVFPEIKTAIISLNWSEMHEYNFKKGDSEGVVNLPLSIKGIDLSVFISVRDDKTKLSFRSRGSFPANKVASEFFSGGGHLNAAGGSSELTVEQTVAYFKTLFPDIKRLLKETE